MEKSTRNKRSILILYGSETGNAADVAERLFEDSQRRHFESRISDMDSFLNSVHTLPDERLGVFVCSTTGQGDMPESMKKFWKFLLRKSLKPNSLANLHFGVLGLGDSSYQKFNFAAKKLQRRLEQLGGKCLLPLGLADDQHDLGYDGICEEWIKDFWEKVMDYWPLPFGVNQIPENELLPSKYKIIWKNNKENTSETVASLDEIQETAPFKACVLKNNRVTAESHFQDTRLISMDIEHSNLKYCPGDVVVIQPQNLSESVQKAFEILDLSDEILDSEFYLEPSNPSFKIPSVWKIGRPSTLRKGFENLFDLQCTPRRSFFKFLGRLSGNEMEREKLEELSSGEGQEDLYDYCNRPKRTVLEVLQDFQHTATQIQPDYFFDLFTWIRPRAFSIASSPSVHINKVQILVAVVEYKTKIAEKRKGLCSTWLSRLKVGDHIPIWVRQGTFTFPSCSTPCIMVGPGTGIAPFRSFIQERNRTETNSENLLFFGCRGREKDFYFKKEWEEIQNSDNTKLILKTAFSRDQNHKVYVQHKIEEEKKLVWELINARNASVFIAGSSNQMPDNVMESLKLIASSEGQMSSNKVQSYFEKLERSGRIQMETWS